MMTDNQYDRLALVLDTLDKLDKVRMTDKQKLEFTFSCMDYQSIKELNYCLDEVIR